MREHVVEIIVSVIIIIYSIIVLFIMTPYILDMEIKRTERAEQMEECEHEWAITSEYSLFGYRTVSKCIKCGKVIR